jgi:hypothetical protein
MSSTSLFFCIKKNARKAITSLAYPKIDVKRFIENTSPIITESFEKVNSTPKRHKAEFSFSKTDKKI